MQVPLWLALLVVGYLGVKLIRPPAWLIAVLLLGGFLLADSVFAPVVDSFLKKPVQEGNIPMLRPKVPASPTPTGHVSPPALVEPTTVVQHPTTPAPVAPAPVRPTIQLTPGAVLALVGGGTAVVLVVGAVVVSMLLAIALTGASLAICALVIRSLLTTDAKRR